MYVCSAETCIAYAFWWHQSDLTSSVVGTWSSDVGNEAELRLCVECVYQ